MIEFKNIIENIDLMSAYKDNEYAKLSLVHYNVFDLYGDFITYHIYDKYLNEMKDGSVNMARMDYIEKDGIVLIAEDFYSKDESIVRIYGKYNINTFDLEIILIFSDKLNLLFSYD